MLTPLFARRVSLIFGVITMVAGLLGVPLGAWLGTGLLKRFPRAHPVICGLGLLVSAPAMTLGIVLTQGYFYAPFILMFIGEVALNLNWAIVADMSLVRDAYRREAAGMRSVLLFDTQKTDRIQEQALGVLFFIFCCASRFVSTW